MSSSAPGIVPPGWYPDPSGAQQWRVWTGERWSEMTRSYGKSVATRRPAMNLALAQSMRRVWIIGVIGVIGGVALLASSLAHLPHTSSPAPNWFLAVGISLATALVIIGSIVCAFGVKELQGRWSVFACIPIINLFVASALAAQRLGRNQPLRIFFEFVLLALFALTIHLDAWIAAGPAMVAYIESTYFAAYADQLIGPSPQSDVPAS